MNNEPKEMTSEEAKAYRASLYVAPVHVPTEKEKREQFRIFWAQNKKKYGKSKDLEGMLWSHLVSTHNDTADKFEIGLAHFGLKKLSN